MIAFSGSPLDRASENRTDPVWLAARRADGLFLPLWQLKVLVTGSGGAVRAVRLSPAQCENLPQGPCVFLGLVEGQALFALDISAAEEDPAKQGPLAGLGLFKEMRPAALVLPAEDTAILGQAKALIDWHQRHGFCPNCGHATRMEDGGYRRTCPHCGAEHFPRVDPVVIMLPVLDDRCLLGHNRRFVDGLYSAFAGFIEPGETVEEAVARELAEEAGVAVEKVTYHSSQAWPFPSALMIGCYAKVASREIAIDGKEITDARWMTRQELRERLAGRIKDGVSLPIPIAIAHHLIKDWAEDF